MDTYQCPVICIITIYYSITVSSRNWLAAVAIQMIDIVH